MFLDRRTSNELTLTQERIAELMGVRRESVTVAATKLQVAGIIRYHHGRISIVERTGLEAHSCECYAIARRETDRLMEAQTAVGRARIELPERLFPTGEMPCSIPLQSY